MTRHPLFWLPNFLTIIRCFMGVFVAWIIIAIARHELALPTGPDLPVHIVEAHGDAKTAFRRYWGGIAFLVFAASAATDWLDGYLARKWDAVSQFGRLLDPIADKITVGLPLLAIAAAAGWTLPVTIPVMIILFRDTLITLLRFSGLNASSMAVSWIAKFKTFIEMVLIAVFLCIMAVMDQVSGLTSQMLTIWIIALWFVAFLSAYTGTMYLIGLVRKKPAMSGE